MKNPWHIHTLVLVFLSVVLTFITASDSRAANTSTAAIDLTTQTLISQMFEAYESVKSVYIEGDTAIIMRARGQQQTLDIPLKIAFERPDKFMTVFDHSVMGFEIYSNGSELYSYLPGLEQYRMMKAPANIKDIRLSDALTPNAHPSGVLMIILSENPQKNLVEEARSITMGNQEEIDGNLYHMIKIEQKNGALAALVIDPESFLLKEIRMNMSEPLKKAMPDAPDDLLAVFTEKYSLVKTNESMPESTFTFTVPEGTTRVETFIPPDADNETTASQIQGETAPSFNLKDLDGNSVSLDDFKGNVVLVDFWSVQCPPCVNSMPFLQGLYKRYQDKGLRIIGITSDADLKEIKKIADKTKVKYPILLDTQGIAFTAYNIYNIPHVFVINRDGKIVADFIGSSPAQEKSLESAIQAILGIQEE